MGAYNFQQRFVPYVLDGSKTHTIRGVRRHADRPGATAHLFTGLRTPSTRKLFSAPIVKVESITITGRYEVVIDGIPLTDDERDMLAWRDGFRLPFDGADTCVRGCFDLMREFWGAGGTEQKRPAGSPHTVPFHGHVIHWDYGRRLSPDACPSLAARSIMTAQLERGRREVSHA